MGLTHEHAALEIGPDKECLHKQTSVRLSWALVNEASTFERLCLFLHCSILEESLKVGLARNPHPPYLITLSIWAGCSSSTTTLHPTGDVWSPWPVFSRNHESRQVRSSLTPMLPLSTFHPLTPTFSSTINSSFSLLYLELSPVFLPLLQNLIAVVPAPIAMVPSVMSASPCFKTCPWMTFSPTGPPQVLSGSLPWWGRLFPKAMWWIPWTGE